MEKINSGARGRARLRGWRFLLSVLGFSMAAVPGQAGADAGWFDSGDTQLRMDLQLLNDAEIIRYPLNQWPVPRAGVQYALANAKEHFATNSAVTAALERVKLRAAAPENGRMAFETGVRGGQPGLWRDFDTLAREDGEFGAGLEYDSGPFSTDLEVTAVTNPADGDELRLDGSQLTAQWGNWLISANELDRWWGPGYEGSLILSNNARPMPTLMVERAEARAFETRWLSWLGPWRMNFGFSQMEQHRADVSAPLFMAWRVAIMPLQKVEIGFSRTAQFCGKKNGQDEPCGLTTFKSVLLGHDNPGFTATKQNEPGNQMAGFDLRWDSPLGNLPYALYAQYIGEDVSSYVPVKYLRQLGAEITKPTVDGSLLKTFVEWSDTDCATYSGPVNACEAYNQARFNIEGYRYHGRSVGYTADRNSIDWALGGIYGASDGSLWTATARWSQLSRGRALDPTNPVASVPAEYGALEMGWKGKLFGEQVSVDLGFQSIAPSGGERDNQVFGFVGWQHEFKP